MRITIFCITHRFYINSKLVETWWLRQRPGMSCRPIGKGKIAFGDPNKSGSSFTALCTMLQVVDAEE